MFNNHFFTLAKILLCGSLAFFSQQTFAIAYGMPDCTNYSSATSCQHPNVAAITAMNTTIPAIYPRNCSPSVLQVDNKKIVFLMAGHCVSAIKRIIASGSYNSVGINLDPDVGVGANGPGSLAENWVSGGIMVRTPAQDQSNNGNRVDVALALYPLDAKNAKGETIHDRWDSVPGALTPVTLTQDIAPSLEAVVNSVPNPAQNFKFSAAGYGSLEELTWPGSNAGGPDLNLLGQRRYSPGGSYRALHDNMFTYSENPALGDSGPCFGDSGGPNYFTWVGKEVVAGVTSSGDALCRSINTASRVDSPAARAMVSCARDPNKTIQDVVDCVNAIPAK